MIDLGNNLEWNNNIELYLKALGEKCLGYSILHKQAEATFSSKAVLIDIPSIILSTIAGTLSIGSSTMFGNDIVYSQIGIGALSLIVGIIQTINSYFSWNKRSENHRISHLQYGKLYRFISIELSLPQEQRIRCNDLMKVVRQEYEELQKISPLIPDDIINDFKKKYVNYNTSKPQETNGLEEIVIYTEETINEIVNENQAV